MLRANVTFFNFRVCPQNLAVFHNILICYIGLEIVCISLARGDGLCLSNIAWQFSYACVCNIATHKICVCLFQLC